MIIMGSRIKLDKEELKLMSEALGEPVNPTTVEDFNAWVERLKSADNPTPEDLLMNAIIDTIKLVDGNQENQIKAVLAAKNFDTNGRRRT